MTAATKHIEAQLKDKVLYLTFSRPHSRNALTREMIDEIESTFADLVGTDTRIVVLRGRGGNFCAGGDVKEMSLLLAGSQSGNFETVADYSIAYGRLLQTVNNAPQAVIAVLEGTVLGGGLGLACVADVVIAVSDARFGLPETTLGLVPAQIAPYVLKKVGESNARLLGIMGAQFDAASAQRFGFVHYVVDDAAQADIVLNDTIAKIRACAPEALAKTKELMTCEGEEQEVADVDMPVRLGGLFARVMAGEEAREGTAAFKEKRKPRWAVDDD